MTEIAFLFPGQGSQYVGMGRTFYDAYPSVRRLYDEASEVTGQDMARLCFEGPDAVLVQTDNVQPAITLVNLACLQVLHEEGVEPALVAGHSVGEYSALAAAGALSFRDALRLVQVRGAAMKAEAERRPGGMAAVLGADPAVLAELCEQEGGGGVQIANYNTPGQIVITGTTDGLQAVSKAAKARGAKLVVPLKVSGAWHSRFMLPAQEPLMQALAAADVRSPRVPVLANLTAEPYPADPDVIRQMLVSQIVSPVLWTQSMSALVNRGCRTFVEAGPGRVLSGLMKDVARGLQVNAVQDVDTLARLKAALTPPAS